MATKEEVELQKLEAEVAALNRPYYRTPTWWISVITAFVAVGGVIGQSFVSKIERAQAVVDRDRALLAQERAEKARDAVELERTAKKSQVDRLTAEGEALATENRNKSEKLANLLAELAKAPRPATTAALDEAKIRAAKSLFATAIYSFGLSDSAVKEAVGAVQAAGYSVIKTEALAGRNAWLSPSSQVLYYDEEAREEAKSLADLLKRTIGKPVGIQKGAGAGIPQGKEKSSLRVHLIG